MHNTGIPAVAAEGSAHAIIPFPSDAKVIGQDGALWPVDRPLMRQRDAICARMAEDFLAVIAKRGAETVVTTDDFLLFGWTRQQVTLYGLQAITRAAEMNAGGGEAFTAAGVA